MRNTNRANYVLHCRTRSTLDIIGTSEIEHGLCACTVDNPLAKARGLSLSTGAQTMPCLSLVVGYDLIDIFPLLAEKLSVNVYLLKF